jgi:hypothetical protein
MNLCQGQASLCQICHKHEPEIGSHFCAWCRLDIGEATALAIDDAARMTIEVPCCSTQGCTAPVEGEEWYCPRCLEEIEGRPLAAPEWMGNLLRAIAVCLCIYAMVYLFGYMEGVR